MCDLYRSRHSVREPQSRSLNGFAHREVVKIYPLSVLCHLAMYFPEAPARSHFENGSLVGAEGEEEDDEEEGETSVGSERP